ncbi:MAG: sodium:calcium antiporter [Chloroflexi bacterium]|nr:sodium:calcium antiporter [Chloroflexota bacterium]MYD49517.1 sodium:calcium antiporter [Chloroflexota bacterium]
MLNLLSGVGLPVAIVVFLASAVAVVFLGTYLARYGDALASLTGLGRLFVGSILVALATSLPEVSNNITAVRIDNPQLALGDVLGSNMFNILILAVVALIFGGKRFIQRVAPEQGYLIVLAAALTGLAVIFSLFKSGVTVWQVGLSSIIVLVVYLVGMWIVYERRPAASDEDADEETGITLRRAWVMFSLVSVGVIISGILLAQSMDQIAHETGISSGVLGILAVALVTSMPEISATFAAARLGAADLGFAGVYGSCVFNITILAYADFFYRKGVVVNTAELEHYIAGIIALGLIVMGGLLLWGRNRLPQSAILAGLSLMLLITVAGSVWVALLGAPSH